MRDIQLPALCGAAAAMAAQAARLASLAQDESCPELSGRLKALSQRMAGQAQAVAAALQASRRG